MLRPPRVVRQEPRDQIGPAGLLVPEPANVGAGAVLCPRCFAASILGLPRRLGSARGTATGPSVRWWVIARRRLACSDSTDMFLESIENLRPLVERARGRTPSAGLAREMTSCLQQGRLFYESADQSDLAIRPLLLFYGTMAYAKALIALQTLNSLSTLRPAHGINDKSRDDSRVDELEVVIGDHAGTFQAFNDAVAPLNRFTYIDGSTTNWASLPFHTGKYPPAKPGALGCEPLKAAWRGR